MNTYPQGDCTYVPGETPSWDEGVSRLNILEAEKLVVGPCPRCGHQLNWPIEDPTPVITLAREKTVRIFVECNCDQAHEGRPDGKAGCGAYGALDVEL